MIDQKKILRSMQDPTSKRDLNKELFSVVAKKYDLITRLLSFGYDASWKKTLVEKLPNLSAPVCVDLACGTGDICALLSARFPQGEIVGIDITPAMLSKAKLNHPAQNITYIQSDMSAIPFHDESIDVITGGYALRNAPQLDQLLNVVWHKLKPGGVATFLDFSKSDQKMTQKTQLQLLKIWTGLWGIIFHANPAIYCYIPDSLALFPTQSELKSKILQLGFTDYQSQDYLQGFVSLIQFIKPKH